MDNTIEGRIQELENRVDFQEKIHDKVNADGNFYHYDFRFNDVVKLVSIGIAIGAITASVTFVILNWYKNNKK